MDFGRGKTGKRFSLSQGDDPERSGKMPEQTRNVPGRRPEKFWKEIGKQADRLFREVFFFCRKVAVLYFDLDPICLTFNEPTS